MPEIEDLDRLLGEVTGSHDLLADNPVLARSITNRFPYLDPLHVLQVDLLERLRAGDDLYGARPGVGGMKALPGAGGLKKLGDSGASANAG